MTALLRQLFTLEPDFAWNPRRQRAGLLAMLESASDRRVLVACLGDLVVGMVTLQCVVSTAEGGLSGWVEDVVVDSAWRGKGIGRWLLMALENWAKARGLTRLQLLADRENLRAMEFYARHGWQPTRMVAWRKKL
jgi:GNAT superfamily N-acetyltransferase